MNESLLQVLLIIILLLTNKMKVELLIKIALNILSTISNTENSNKCMLIICSLTANY